jgi:hypothetical protein
VGHPRPNGKSSGDFGNRAVGDTEQDELCVSGRAAKSALGQTRGDRRTQSPVSDDADVREHERRY